MTRFRDAGLLAAPRFFQLAFLVPPSRAPLLASVSLIIGFALTAPALAHAHLTSALPPVNGTVPAPPKELDLSFSEGLNLAFTGPRIAGPDKASVPTGEARLGAGGDTSLVVPLSGALGPGTYTVDWHALSSDGHKTKGRYTFTIKP